jgi:hypothetical protein
MQSHEIDAPMFPVVPRPSDERMAPSLLHTLWRWAARGAIQDDALATLSRSTGGRV